jgi:DNA-binding transcriptional MerR regulator
METEITSKGGSAFRTIGELATELNVPQHILRYWETRFPQLRPIQRAGNRRYYRPDDVALVRRINQLLNHDGYTVKGVQKLLALKPSMADQPREPQAVHETDPAAPTLDIAPLIAIRARLARALEADQHSG